jgi:hypothetical protein|nr:MAG TPA: hypothetical protein [Caudoviricetes sp.]
MKDKLIDLLTLVLSILLLVIGIIGFGYIAIYLGMKLPYELFNQGNWGFAIAQLIIVWSWLLLGGKRK